MPEQNIPNKAQQQSVQDNTATSQEPINTPLSPNSQKHNSSKMFILIILLILLLIGGGIVGFILLMREKAKQNEGSQTTEKQSCSYNNATYKDGASFKSTDGCNTCSCNDGQVACTLMACTATTTTTTASPNTIVKVYFADPATPEDLETLKAVDRSTNSADLYKFALDQLLAGPTTAEKTSGYFLPFKLTGTSNCFGADYSMTVSGNTVNLRFCKQIETLSNPTLEDSWAGMGITLRGRAFKVIEKTLKFGNVEVVFVKASDGHCYAMDAGVNDGCTE